MGNCSTRASCPVVEDATTKQLDKVEAAPTEATHPTPKTDESFLSLTDPDEKSLQGEPAASTEASPPKLQVVALQPKPAVSKQESPLLSRFHQKYELSDKILGKGGFSICYEGTRKADGKRVAVKVSRVKASEKENWLREVHILKDLKHPHIMELMDFFEPEPWQLKSAKSSKGDRHYVVTELLEGGELFERIVEKTFYSEQLARTVVINMLEAVAYMHARGVAHRDLKPENLLLESHSSDTDVQIADFGFAKVSTKGHYLHTALGTPGYVAPEILKQLPYGIASDIWSLGVITYILLCGYPPFHSENHAELFDQIKAGNFEFEEEYWCDVSPEAKDMVRSMLVVNPAQRLTAQELLQHEWVDASIPAVPLTIAQQNLARFNARRRFRKAVKTVQAVHRFSRALGALGVKAPSAAATAAAAVGAAGAVGATAGSSAAVDTGVAARSQTGAFEEAKAKLEDNESIATASTIADVLASAIRSIELGDANASDKITTATNSEQAASGSGAATATATAAAPPAPWGFPTVGKFSTRAANAEGTTARAILVSNHCP